MTSASERSSTPLCGGCKAYGRCRLGIGDLVREGPRTHADVRCAEIFHAGPRVAHGGWTAAMFDDVMGRTMIERGVQAVTGSLTIDFLKPVPVEEALVVEVSVGAQEGRRWTLSASLRLARDEVSLASAKGVWVERRKDHFERHEAAMEMYRRALD